MTMATDKRAAVKQELRSRLMAERDFLSFCKHVDAKHPVDARHVQVLAHKLEQVAKYILSGGKEGISRLMVFMPPRYWKSQTASRKFPAWLMGKNPDLRIIMTSYNADLASKHSKAVRDLITSEEYSQVFGALASTNDPVMLDPESKASAAWEIAERNGGMLAAGVGGGITGFGANLFIIDDPVKGRKEASSETLRRDNYEWYRSTAYTRLEDHAAIIVIMTRWDVEDLSGELLKAMVSDPEADQWDVVFMPAVALDANQYPRTRDEFVENLLRGVYVPMGGDQLGRVPGEPLWERKHDGDMLKALAVNMDDFEFQAQYQQMPRLAQGNFFDESDFQIVERAPDGLQWYRYVDLALGKTEQSDFNATAAVAMDDMGDEFIRDMVKEKDLDLFLGSLKALMLSDEEAGTIWGIEDNAFQSLVVKQFLADRDLARISILGMTRTSAGGDKTQWAQPWRMRAKQGKVKLVRGPWNLSFLRTATAFPNGRNDDEVDTVSGGNQMIADNVSGTGRTASVAAVVAGAEELFGEQLSMMSY
jgi:phage terminase large subunit-like protein